MTHHLPRVSGYCPACGGALLDCPLGEHLASLSRPPAPPGRYRATSVGDGWHWKALP